MYICGGRRLGNLRGKIIATANSSNPAVVETDKWLECSLKTLVSWVEDIAYLKENIFK